MSFFSIFQNHNKSNADKEEKIIQIGIDFGTSITKVCYRFYGTLCFTVFY